MRKPLNQMTTAEVNDMLEEAGFLPDRFQYSESLIKAVHAGTYKSRLKKRKASRTKGFIVVAIMAAILIGIALSVITEASN